jgi:hypothetical protein
MTFAYTVGDWDGSPFRFPPARVVSLEGDIRVDGGPAPAGALTPDGLFDRVEEVLSRATDVTYDQATGLPVSVHAYGPPGGSDMDTNITVSDFVVSGVGRIPFAARVAAARRAWSRTQPASFDYTWTRTPAGGTSPEVSYTVTLASGGRIVFAPELTPAGEQAQAVASVPATLDVADAASAAGAWVDLTVGDHGVPTLLAVDPTPSQGDAYWVTIPFRDTGHDEADAAYRAAHHRWVTTRLTTYRYVWQYRTVAGTYAYRVTIRGDRMVLTRMSGSKQLRGSVGVGPKIGWLYLGISDALANGGRVVATYDSRYGYPTKVEIESADGSRSGTITIRGFRVP